MQLRKCLTLLAVLLVGFGVVAVDDANAAAIASVTITAPSDSGALRGIDSTFTVVVKVRDYTPIDSLECVIYLTTSTDCTVVVDAHVDKGAVTYGALNEVSVIVIARGGLMVHSPGGAISNETLTSAAGQVAVGGTNTQLIAIHAYKALSLTSPTNFDGDGDSLRTASSDDTTTFTWYGKIHHSSGTVPEVRAAAFTIDDATTNPPIAATADTSAIVVSASSLKINIDADRPIDPATMVWSTAASTVGNMTGSVHHTITGFTAAADDKVLGIGDTIKMDVDLGSQTDPVLGADSLAVAASVFNEFFPVSKAARTGGTLNYRQVLAADQYSGNLLGADNVNATDTLAVYIVDLAGNLSGSSDAAAKGVTLGVAYFVDVLGPVLDGQIVGGDTILPVSNDTITDGGMRSGYQDDINQLTFQLAEALDTLIIKFDGPKTRTIKLTNESSPKNISDVVLGKLAASRIIDFTDLGNNAAGSTDPDSFFVGTTAGVSQRQYDNDNITGNDVVIDDTAADSVLTTGLYTITFQGVDLAGNTGVVLTRSNVLVDVDDIELKRLFPTAASALDTLERETSVVVFQLSEPADSLLITYIGIAGADDGKTRTRALVSGELTALDKEYPYRVDSLQHGTTYTLQILAADLAGNYTQTALDTFVYDTTYVVPVIKQFAVTASVPGPGTPVDAGSSVTLTLTAQTTDEATAVTYKEAAELKVTPGCGVALTGNGVLDLGNGRATLSGDDWVVGERTVTLTDTTSPDTLSITVQDCTDTTNLYIGTFDSTIVIRAAARTQIVVDAAESVGQGDTFWVDVSYADEFGNARVTDNGFVNVSASKLGVKVPVGDVPITKGIGGFWAKSSTWSGDGLVITARDVIYNGDPDGYTVISGTDTISVSGDGATVLDAPDTVLAQDYMGAKGLGDQGGFITLSFDPSADHATLTGYRIYREVAVFSGYDTGGNLVALSEPVMEMIPWGIVDAVPGADPVYVVVATLDGDSTTYGVAAERGTLTTAKSAFDGAESIATPYEMLAETMQKSRAAATDGPVFAALTPEALAFGANGIVPRMKLVDGVEQSNITRTASAVRAVDNIAPEAVAFMQTMDTPDDAGSSITVTWAKSPSDQMVTQIVPQAIGGSNVYTTAGVKGYNVYRKVGDAAYTLVGSASAGETSFVDETAFNGVRYTYQVRPFDADNITASEIEKSSMAIRNNVVDANGASVYGLFGVDNKVDYDDFFIFADHFGLSAGQDAFDRAFDLAPNNTIDFDDFFAFADNFGREIVATGKVVPMMAGLNSDARFYLDAGSDLPRVGEELVIDVNIENFIELKGYGFGLNYDASVLEFVGARVENNILGEGQLAQPQVVAQGEGTVSLGAFGDVATKGELGLGLVFRTLEEIEASYIEITEGALQDGSYGLNSVTGPVSVRIETRPEVYALSDNYPNPFNPETTIKYQLPEAGDVTLEVYNMLGQVVRTLVSEQQNAGRYVLQWDANNDAGQALSSGIYFYRIQAGGEFQSVKKMLLLK